MKFTLDVSVRRFDFFRLKTDGTFRAMYGSWVVQPVDQTFPTVEAVYRRIDQLKSPLSIDGKTVPLPDPESVRNIFDEFADPHVRVHRDKIPSPPSIEDVRAAIATGDDQEPTVLIVQLDGSVRLVPFTGDLVDRPTFAVRIESFSGFGYTGPDAAEDDDHVQGCLRVLLSGWIVHLETGEVGVYSDVSTDTDENLRVKIEEVTAKGNSPTMLTDLRSAFSSKEQFYSARELESKKFLAKGGNAEIWIAHRRRLENDVVVKFLRPNKDDTPTSVYKARQRLLREGQILATIRHPNVVRILDLSLINEDPVLILDYILGKSVEETVKVKRLDSRETIIHLLALLDALKECHEKGICHRDISPRNVIIEQSGRAVLIDFGLGYSEELALENRLTSHVQGTRGFIAPELLYDHLNVRPTVDIYGIGALGVYMLTGQTPNPTIPLDIPNISNSLLRVLQRAIAPTPERRLQTAEAMSIVLASILDPQKNSNSVASKPHVSTVSEETCVEALGIEDLANVDEYTKQVIARFTLALSRLIEQQADDRGYATLLAAARYRLHDPSLGKPMSCESGLLLEALGHLLAGIADLAELPPSERVDSAFNGAIKEQWLKIKDLDIWHPGMAPGTGHRDSYIPTGLAFRWLRQKTGFMVEPRNS